MCSFGAAVTYFYVCLTTFLKADAARVRIEAAVGAFLSVCFALLLIVPASPAALSVPARIFLGIWIALGAVLFVRVFMKDGKRQASR